MKDEVKTKKQLISELAELRLMVSQYEESTEGLGHRMDELTLTFQCIGDGVIISGEDGKTILMNTKAGELTGWRPEEALGKEIEEVLRLYKNGDRQSPIEPAKEVLKTGEKLGLPRDTVLIKRDGSTRFISASFAPLSYERKEFSGVVVVFRDITRIRNAEEALIESEKKYRTIVENSYDLIYEVDTAGRILYVNPICTELTGYDQSELLGKAAFDFIHPEDRPTAMSIFMRAVSSLSTEKVTFRAMNKAGEYQWLECAGKPYIAADGEIRGVIITRNITDRKRAEEELLALNTLMKAVHRFLDLREVYNVALDMVINMENVDMAMIYLVDKIKKEAVVQAWRNVPEFYIARAGRLPYSKGLTWKVINSGAIVNIEDAQKDEDVGLAGRELGHHSLLGIPIYMGDEVIGVIWFLSYKERRFSENEMHLLSAMGDQIAIAIAKAKMLEEIESTQEKLVQSEKLASLGQLISSIAHEINNPLTPIMGYSQRLLMHPDLDEKQRRSLEIINTSAQRMAQIIEKLLSFSRKDRPLRTYEDINSLVEQSLDFCESQLKLGNIEVIKDLDAGITKTMVDSVQIQQVLTNIILNAEQAIIGHRDQGQLRVTTRIRNDSVIEITFTDDGPGIPKDLTGKVFDPFFTTKEPGKGIGLGLAVAYGIIHEHGGEIRALSREGEGATFIIELPVLAHVEKKDNSNREKITAGLLRNEGKRIMIVEDEEIVIDLIKGVLEDEDLAIDSARNGEDALEKIASNEYELIVCDIKMPKMSGIAFYKEVKSLDPGLAKKVIFITGDPSSETINFLNETGNEYITKPFKVDKFKARVYEFLNPGVANSA